MHRYYFDLSDQNGRFVDDEGMDFNNMDAVEREAAQAMADAARHSFQRPIKPAEIVIEVRDDAGPVMRVRLALEIERSKSNKSGIEWLWVSGAGGCQIPDRNRFART